MPSCPLMVVGARGGVMGRDTWWCVRSQHVQGSQRP